MKIGSIVQIVPHPERDDFIFGGALMVVTELKTWGAQGYVTIPGRGQAYFRARNEDMEDTGGTAKWIVGEDLKP